MDKICYKIIILFFSTKSNISEKMSHSCDSNKALSISTASDVITIEEPMEDNDSLSTSGINSNISENSSFNEHTKRKFA